MSAQVAFEQLKAYMDSKEIHYVKDDENFILQVIFKTDDIDLKHTVVFHDELPVFTLYSWFPFKFSEELLIDSVLATSMVNRLILDGHFNVDVKDGQLSFKATIPYSSEVDIPDDIFEYLFMMSNAIVDQYNDIFFDLSKGKIDLDQFNQLINK